MKRKRGEETPADYPVVDSDIFEVVRPETEPAGRRLTGAE